MKQLTELETFDDMMRNTIYYEKRIAVSSLMRNHIFNMSNLVGSHVEEHIRSK